MLRQHGVEISVAHRGRPWENGYAERLIRTLKEEEVHLNGLSEHPRSQRSHRAFYHTRLSSETPTCGVRVFDAYGISAKKLVLTLGNFGPNKWWHYNQLEGLINKYVEVWLPTDDGRIPHFYILMIL